VAHILSVDWDFFFRGAAYFRYGCNNCSWRDCAQNPSGHGGRPIVAPRRQNRHRDHDVEPILPAGQDPATWLLRNVPVAPPTKGFRLFAAECHAELYGLLGRDDTIVHLDAHQDQEPTGTPRICCGSWGYKAKARLDCKIQWHGHADLHRGQLATRPPTQDYCLVFTCWSRPWTPAAHDVDWFRFIKGLAIRLKCDPQFIGPEAPEMTQRYRRARKPGKMIVKEITACQNT